MTAQTFTSASGDTSVTVELEEDGALLINVERFGHNANSFSLPKENRAEDDTVEPAPPAQEAPAEAVPAAEAEPEIAVEEDDEEHEDDEVERDVPPARRANKQAWVNYAVRQGADEEAAEALTKDELVELYGE